jgi:V8-like Glu-specific endopeptidase
MRYYKQDWVVSGPVKETSGGSIPLAILFSLIIFVALGVMAFLFGGALPSIGRQDLKNVVLIIEVQFPGVDGRFFGSGVLIKSDGTLITTYKNLYRVDQNGNLVKPSKVVVYLPPEKQGDQPRAFEAQALDANKSPEEALSSDLQKMWHDWELVKIKNPPQGLRTLPLGDSANIKPQDKITVAGLSQAAVAMRYEGISIADGQVTKVVPPDNPRNCIYFAHDVKVDRGSSGSAVVDQRTGQLIGLHIKTDTDERTGRSEYFAVPSRKLADAWRAAGLDNYPK